MQLHEEFCKFITVQDLDENTCMQISKIFEAQADDLELSDNVLDQITLDDLHHDNSYDNTDEKIKGFSQVSLAKLRQSIIRQKMKSIEITNKNRTGTQK